MHKDDRHKRAKEKLIIDITEYSKTFFHLFEHSNYINTENSFSVFTKHFFKSIAPEHLEKTYGGVQKDTLIKTLIKSWQILQHKTHGPIVNIDETDREATFVTILVQDQPFLVDTVLLTLKKYNITASFIFHPVLPIVRNSQGNLIHVTEGQEKTHESLIAFWLDDDAVAMAPTQLKEELFHALQLAICVVDDFPNTCEEISKLAKNYEEIGQTNTDANFQEIAAFLNWVSDDQLTILGSRYFTAKTTLPSTDGENSDLPLNLSFELNPTEQQKKLYGLFRDTYFMGLPELWPAICHMPSITSYSDYNFDLRAHGRFPLVTISKSFQRSPVHRHSRIDSFEILDMDENGTIFGLLQIIGIFTRDFFTQSAFRIPLLRHKVNRIFQRFGYSKQSHDGKYVLSILKSISQDELFQFNEEQLYQICAKVFNLYNRLAVFTRNDVYERFTSVLIYLPKERYKPEVKENMRQMVQEMLCGYISSEQVFISEFPFARLIFVVSFSSPKIPHFAAHDLEEKLETLSRSWKERLNDCLMLENQTQATLVSFPKSYEDTFCEEDGFKDAQICLQSINENNLKIRLSYEKSILRINVISPRTPISLSNLMPLWESFGLKTICENSYSLSYQGDLETISIWLHAFECVGISRFDKDVEQRLTEAFYSVWEKSVENDDFNKLVLKTNLTIHHVAVFRTYSKAMKQMIPGFSPESLMQALIQHPNLTEKYFSFFHNRFSPYIDESIRAKTATFLCSEIKSMVLALINTNEQRAFERLLNMMECTVRTNYYCGNHPKYLSLKFLSPHIKDIPQPAPMYEIFIYSEKVEACHLRGGKVSRGGIRWSDRMDDFRLEVFSLMRAQMLKNSIIIPLGSKGGFICKRYEQMKADGASATTLKDEVIDCYKTMIRGMLDITDTVHQGECAHPTNVICYDGNDPYLVVAADKGTAAFSDTANALSKEYDFWLGDAFASGGSFGYDHKKMAITSKGAWISALNHFHRLNINTNQDFTVIGVGDMSGDVFGNGMLQSKNICLVAAFNHQHIFIDPTPHAENSFYERQRLFDLPNSTWADYNTSILSAGGGIFSRSAGYIPLNKHIHRILQIPNTYDTITPNDLIQFILKAPVDLLWFGGIGTYVKAASESHHQVNDRNNDLVRVDAADMEAKIIVEGANLGVTQQGRIEFSKKQGRINTDAIDNSAGVSCSDHEVNIKILCQQLMIDGKITITNRNSMLEDMWPEVAQLVLSDNMKQNLALNFMEYVSQQDLPIYKNLIYYLEKSETLPLKRKGEFIPTDEEINERNTKGKGLTRPELAIVMAYTKINLYENLLKNFQNSQYCLPQKKEYLHSYFPKLLHDKYADIMDTHPLKNEIIATVLVNTVVNCLGAPYILEMCQATSREPIHIIQAFADLDELFDFKNIWDSWQQGYEKEDANTYQGMYEFTQGIKQLTLVALRNRNILKTKWDKINIILPQILDIFITYQQEYLSLSPTKQPFLTEIGPFLPVILELTCHMDNYDQTDRMNELLKTFWDVRTELQLQSIYEAAQKIPCSAEWQRETKFTLLDDLVQVENKLVWRILGDGGFTAWCLLNQKGIEKHNIILGWVQGALTNPYEKVDAALVLHAVNSLKLFC